MSSVRRVMPTGEIVVAATLRQLRQAVRRAMRNDSVRRAVARTECCSEKTLYRILGGGNVTVGMAARVIDRLGGKLEIGYSDKRRDDEKR